jgi:nucleotide-binding universal stress UspA family protein
MESSDPDRHELEDGLSAEDTRGPLDARGAPASWLVSRNGLAARWPDGRSAGGGRDGTGNTSNTSNTSNTDNIGIDAGSRSDKLIMVPLDGSPLAERVLPHAAALARATSSGLLLMRMVPPITLIEPMGGITETTLELWRSREKQPEIAQQYLRDVVERLRSVSLQVNVCVTEGEPAEAILKYAAEHPEVTAIAMSTHGRSGWSRWLFGSVAERVLQGSPMPLLLLRPEVQNARVDLERAVVPRYMRLLVPLDGSGLAEQALPHAIKLAQGMGGRLMLISVTSTPFDLRQVRSDLYGEWSAVPWGTPAERHVRYLNGIAEKLADMGMPAEGRVTYGDPAEEILKSAKDEQADIIVMTTHGRNGLGHMLIGSIAGHVAQAACVPMLLVRVKNEPAEQQHAEHVPSATPAGKGTGEHS